MALVRALGSVALLALCWSTPGCLAAPSPSVPAAPAPASATLPAPVAEPAPAPPSAGPAPAPAAPEPAPPALDAPAPAGSDPSQLPQRCADDRAQPRPNTEAPASNQRPATASSVRGALDPARVRAAVNPNYQVHVREDNQRPLDAAKEDFTGYLGAIHDRVHPHFSLKALPRLGGLPCSDPINDYDLHVQLELVVSSKDGQLLELGIVRTSGVDAFDEVALEAVLSGAPFGKPPSSIVSRDGNVYVQWGMHRNPLLACSTYFAKPFLI